MGFLKHCADKSNLIWLHAWRFLIPIKRCKKKFSFSRLSIHLHHIPSEFYANLWFLIIILIGTWLECSKTRRKILLRSEKVLLFWLFLSRFFFHILSGLGDERGTFYLVSPLPLIDLFRDPNSNWGESKFMLSSFKALHEHDKYKTETSLTIKLI